MDNLTLDRLHPGVEPADEVAGRVRLLIGQIPGFHRIVGEVVQLGLARRRLNQLQIVALDRPQPTGELIAR